jgi:hypothetical protein
MLDDDADNDDDADGVMLDDDADNDDDINSWSLTRACHLEADVSTKVV